MEFKNVCALLKVTVNASDVVVTPIEVENTGTDATGTDGVHTGYHSGRPLWGDFEITFDPDDNWQPLLREQSNLDEDLAAKYITKEVTLECEHHGDYGGVSVSGSHPFYIYLPPVGYHNLHVTVYAKDVTGQERCTTLVSSVNSSFQAHTIYPLSVTYNSNTWTPLSRAHDLGPFSVSTTKQVVFSFSNLHNDGEVHGTDEGYFFPPYQYDFIGYHDGNNDHDHFTNAQRSAFIGSNGFATRNGWSLLTNSEWTYLLETREGHKYVTAIVASVPGSYCSRMASTSTTSHLSQPITPTTCRFPAATLP